MAVEDPLWFKDAVIYQLHVKSFFDADDDGIGDFAGLAQKMDYIKNLGATCVWLLPFYPSPLRDDGYDIADYRNVNPAYGSMREFREFVRVAHARGIRVLTELVINHTSDQHPWFQRARHARPGSAYRDYYVWSGTDRRYEDARIIFTDTEQSNWTWDPVAGAYYWHRFFSHQPDLNFDNPRVVAAMMNVMRFWLDTGVDALRLDAVPYLFEREGTNCENLPETHALLKDLRACIDAEYPGRVLLAEANQWPEDVRAYFGEGDECHMAFHFPLMPRMFMAIAEEDRYPIIDIMRQTPDIPENTQWAIFLRNHDEMTLEMVTAHEREYMYRVYATEPRARINIGIRRRLAPLMENDRRRIELMTGLLMSMPGTPILYYGDEIGMGDNIYLNDRDGVRTPMQWSMDRNGGFSRANPARMYSPPLMDTVYGYQSVNVEAQSSSPSSLINWLRKLIAVRQAHQVFGRGSLAFLMPHNRKVLAYTREYAGEVVLCVANLSHSSQQTELDLSAYKGRVPVEMLGWSAFKAIADGAYVITLPAHAFFWFLLSDTAVAPVSSPAPEELPELVTIVLPRDARNAEIAGKALVTFEHDVLPAYLPKQRWFADKDADYGDVRVYDTAAFESAGVRLSYELIDLPKLEHTYFLPLAIDATAVNTRATLSRVRRGGSDGFLQDGFSSDEFVRALVDDARNGRRREGRNGGVFAATATAGLTALQLSSELPVRRMNVEQSNTSVVLDERIMIKGYRRAHRGPQPELETARFLDAVGYRNTPPLLGFVEYERTGTETMAIAILQQFAENQGDGWAVALTYLDRFFDRRRNMEPQQQLEAPAVAGVANRSDIDEHAIIVDRSRILGVRTAELHRAFATPSGDAAFEPEPTTAADVETWVMQAHATAERALDSLQRERERISPALAERVDRLLRDRAAILERFAVPAFPETLMKTRYHGDYHLGQVLVVADDFLIVDFEGEPGRDLATRRRKSSPLRDVAGMLRSISYAAVAGMFDSVDARTEDISTLEPLARDWEQRTAAAFLEGYRSTIEGCASYPSDPATAQKLLDFFVLEKAFYEMSYELANRPTWLRIPLEGILAILDSDSRSIASR
jgi:maltose alpha-D-glucosyltransferase / alpha-amylase